MRHSRNVGLAVLLLISTATAGFAQAKAKVWEWGFDWASLNLGMDDPSSTLFVAGPGSFRVGMFVNDQVSVELAPSVSYFSSSGSSSNSIGTDIGVLWHLQTDRTKQQIFIRPSFMFDRFSPPTGSATTTKSFSIGAGIRRPMKGGKYHGRCALTYIRGLDDPATNDLSLSAGMSIIP